MRTAADKAAGRAVTYRRAIGGLQAGGRDREALAEALRWLRAEAAHAARIRPAASAALHDLLTAQVATLADAVADPAGAGVPARSARRAERARQDAAGLREAGRHGEALAKTVLRLQAEAATAARADMAAAPALYRQLAGRIAGLAAEVPAWRAPKPGRTHR